MRLADAPVRILFRADARPDLGGGHIMRCLSLANALDRRGCEIAFACAPGSADLVPALPRSGFPYADAENLTDCPLPEHWGETADILFVDLYDTALADEQVMRTHARHLAVIEDLPDRQHDCDLLIDQGFDRTPETYRDRVPEHCQLLLGPNMVPLRPAFDDLRNDSLERRAEIVSPDRILVAMGLTDVREISRRVVSAVRHVWPDKPMDVVLGPRAGSRAELDTLARSDANLSVLVDVDDMAGLMARADLAIGAGGGTALERCVLGLPSVVVILADNQRPAALAMEKAGACIALEDGPDFESRFRALLPALDGAVLRSLSERSARLCDGRGAETIADTLLGLLEVRRQGAS